MRSEHRVQLDALLEIEHGLTEWEVKFIDSIDMRDRERPLYLSDAQAESLDTIHRKHIG